MRSTATLVDDIYEAAFVPDAWTKALDGIAKAVDAEGSVIFTARPLMRWVASAAVDDLVHAMADHGFLSGTRRNHRLERLLSFQDPNAFLDEAEHVTVAEAAEYPIYTEVMAPTGFGFGAGTVIRSPTGDAIGLSIERRQTARPMTAADFALLNEIWPHVARASLIATRLEFERINSAVQALQVAGLPAAVLTAEGRVLATNAGLDAYRPDIDVGAGDRVLFRRTASTAHFRRAMAAIVADGRAGSTSFPLPRGDAAAPAVAHLVPVRGLARDIFSQASAFMILTPVDRTRVPSAETIQGLFDLTPAEAKVGGRLCTGADVTAIAADLGLGRETVRTHVKGILAKSGMARQTDFVAAMATIRPIGDPLTK